MKKYALFADNRIVYIGSSEKQVRFWLAEDLLRGVDHRFLYEWREINEAEEKALKEEASEGRIFLYYPKITPEKYYQ